MALARPVPIHETIDRAERTTYSRREARGNRRQDHAIANNLGDREGASDRRAFSLPLPRLLPSALADLSVTDVHQHTRRCSPTPSRPTPRSLGRLSDHHLAAA